MIDIAKGRYWGLPWSLVSGCTRCSPGCDNCWSAGMAQRWGHFVDSDGNPFIVEGGKFTGEIKTHPERLSIPLKRRKSTVYAVWNDLFHEAVPEDFISQAFAMMKRCGRMTTRSFQHYDFSHTFLVLTKRPQRMLDYISKNPRIDANGNLAKSLKSTYFGLTVCNQQEADEKIPIFLHVPGKRFLSIEPMLGPIDLQYSAFNGADSIESLEGIHAVILGGETGPGARPLHPDWVRSVRDQCAAAGVPFFFKQWGEWISMEGRNGGPYMASLLNDGRYLVTWKDGKTAKAEADPKTAILFRVGRKKADRLLDGRTHDDLPWVRP